MKTADTQVDQAEAPVAGPTRATLERYINLADYAYTSGKTAFSPTLQREIGVKPLTVDGQIVEKLNNRTGFYGEAFVTTGPGPRQVIVAFEGTNVVTPPTDEFARAQIEDDAEIGVGGKAASFGSALKFTKYAMSCAETAGLHASYSLCGHSLGAADAEFVAARTGLGGITFGTPGISTSFGRAGQSSTLMNYVEQGDPVGNYAADSPRYLGDIVQSDDIRHFGTTSLVGATSHSEILKEAAKDYDKGTFDGFADAVDKLGHAAADYHPLGTYAADLHHLTLYQEDKTKGSDSNFFSFVSGGVGGQPNGVPSEKQLVEALFEGAFGTGGHGLAGLSHFNPDATLAHLVAGLFGGAHGRG